MKELEIIQYTDEGYQVLVRYEAWRVAVISYAERFDRTHFSQMERHHLTDEVFVLLQGSAELILGGDGGVPTALHLVDMEQGRLYNVKRDVWHHIFVSRDAHVLVVENENTGRDNTAYCTAADGGVIRSRPEVFSADRLPD